MTTSPQTVLYVLDTLGLSGRTKGIIDLALNLDKKRYRPVFCSLGKETSALADLLRERSIPIEVTPFDGLHPGGVAKLVGLIRKHDVQVIHPVNPRPLLYAGMAAQLTGVRAVGSLSAFACQVPDREYGFLPHQLVNRSRRHAVRNQMAVGMMDYVVAVSETLCERFCRFTSNALGVVAKRVYDALRRRMRAISYGVDIGRYRAIGDEEIAALRAQLGADRDTILIGSVGRLVEQKDYPTQLSAFALAARTDRRLRMVLAGDGPLRADIERQASRLGIADRIVLLGHWARVPALLRSLDTFVLASKFEPYGVALLEAKCAASAIIATSVNEVPSILNHDVTGLVVPAESPGVMADAFLRVAQDGEFRRTLARNAGTEADQKHSIQAVSGSYQELYDEAT